MLWDYHAVQMKVGPYILELNKTLGARATICGGRSALADFCQLKEGWASLTAGLGLGFWETAGGSGVWMHIGYCAQPPRSKSQGKQARPPSNRCTVHARGVKSWGGGFIGMGFYWELNFYSDINLKPNRAAALAEWRQLLSA
jgi:hypothetical protein